MLSSHFSWKERNEISKPYICFRTSQKSNSYFIKKRKGIFKFTKQWSFASKKTPLLCLCWHLRCFLPLSTGRAKPVRGRPGQVCYVDIRSQPKSGGKEHPPGSVSQQAGLEDLTQRKTAAKDSAHAGTFFNRFCCQSGDCKIKIIWNLNWPSSFFFQAYIQQNNLSEVSDGLGK